MELAVHMKNDKTGEERIKKVIGENASMENWTCKELHYGSDWSWTGTEPWGNVKDNVKHIGRGYYAKNITDTKIEELWNEFEDVLFIEAKDFYVNDDVYKDDISLVLASDWQGFSAGTNVESIWRWFNIHHSKGLDYLMNGEA